MQQNISINKLKKVIQMIIPTERSAFEYAAISLNDGTPITDKLADLEANRVMQKWMETPLLNTTYRKNSKITQTNGNYY